MKKNLWVLLALSALIAMFVIAGCAPKPTPTPTPTPTATPTTPPTDTAAPKVVSTDVYKYYGTDLCSTCINAVYPCPDGTNNGSFKVVITFDENIDTLISSCMLNPNSWTISVSNAGRLYIDATNPVITAQVFNVAVDGKQVVLTAGVVEEGTNTVFTDPATEVPVDYFFCGLICNTDDAKAYAAKVNGIYDGWSLKGVIPAPTKADEVKWTLVSSCVVADELGNVNCGYTGSDCCLEATCTSCDEGCPFSDPTCPTCVNPCE